MAKIFETSEEIVEKVEKQFSDCGLEQYGLTLKIMSLTKAKEVVKASKASATTEFLTKKDGIIQIQVYEVAFDRMDEECQQQLIEMALSNVSYDSEKDKINIETNPYISIFNMRKKYGNEFIDKLELSQIIINEIETEEKERKEAEKLAKKAARESKMND